MKKRLQKLLALLLTGSMLFSLLLVNAAAANSAAANPFPAGEQGSSTFRIPALVSLKDGTIIAACDARWTTYADGGGLDTIVAYSKDYGSSWISLLANYLGDNGNVWNAASTAFIDPAIATDGSTVYLVADLFPAGYALNGANNSPVAGFTGYTKEGYLSLRFVNENNRYSVSFYSNSQLKEEYQDLYNYITNPDSYSYYLKDGKIYQADGTAVEGYTVDGKFNITGDGVSTNLFCADSPYQPWPTDYLYLTRSTDGGATWSDPTLINVKYDFEQTCLVGPGTGIVLDDGTIVFACYEYTSGTQVSSLIYSEDGGATWQRTAGATTRGGHWSSEAVPVQVDSNTIRLFYRDSYATLYYTDYTRSGGGWAPGSPVDTGVSKTYNNQISAIRYSQLIDGKQAILVSTANGGGRSRSAGTIYTFLLNGDNTMELAYTYSVNGSDYYAYSSLAELADGSIGLLYESASTAMTYINRDMSEIAPRAVIGGDPAVRLTIADNQVLVNKALTIGSEVINAPGSAITWTSSDEAIATVTSSGTVTGAAVGDVTITASITVEGKSYSDSVALKVINPDDVVLPDDYTGSVTSEALGEAQYQLDTDGIDSRKEYVVVYSNTAANRILYNVSGNDNSDQVTPTLSSDKSVCALDTKFAAECQLWTVEEVAGGYALKGVSSGTYLNLNGTTSAKIPLSSTAQALTITHKGDGVYTISAEVGGTTYYAYHGNNSSQFLVSTSPADLMLYRKPDAAFYVDTSGFASLIAALESLNEVHYTAETWAALQAALDTARAVSVADRYSTQEEAEAAQALANKAARALYTARLNLEEVTELPPDEYLSGLTTINDVDAGTVYVRDASGIDAGKQYAVVYPEQKRILYNISTSALTDQLGITFPKGNSMVTLNPSNGTWNETNQLWTAEAAEGGYALRGVNSGTYLTLSGTTTTKIPLSSTAQTLTITHKGGGVYTIGATVDGKDYFVSHANDSSQFKVTTTATSLWLFYPVELTETTSLSFVDNSGMDALLTVAEKLNEKAYTPETWTAFAAALDAANDIAVADYYTDRDAAIAVRDDLNSAAYELHTAMMALEEHEHVYTDMITPPTCTEGGYTTHTCECGKSYVDTPVDALGHSYTETVVPPTCTQDGYTDHVCSTCGDHYQDTPVTATGHDYEEQVVAPTADQMGYMIHTCKNCGGAYIDSFTDASDHSFQYGITQQATCQAEGEITFTCQTHENCDKNYILPAPKTGHDTLTYVGVIDSTCTEMGYTAFECSVCGETQKAALVPATGHAWGEWEETAAATCSTPGTEQRVCATDPTHVETRETALAPHTEVTDEAIAPTCTAPGLTEGSHCEVCGEVLVAQALVPAIGHNWSAWAPVTAATCTENGLEERICANDANHTENRVVLATGHTAVTDAAVAPTCTETGLTAGSHCKTCGTVLVAQTVVPATGHSWDEGVEKDGTVTYTCSKCGVTRTETLGAQLQLIEGAGGQWKQDSGNTLSFRFNAALTQPISISVDGTKIAETNYTISEDGTTVTLTKDYLATLSTGSHSIVITAANGTSSTSFTVLAKAATGTGNSNNQNNANQNQSNSTTPKTGDNANITLYVTLLILAVCLLAALAVYGIRKKRN